MTPWLNLCGWIACVVYSTIPSFWLLIHPRVEYWRSRKRSPYLVLLPAWVAMWIFVSWLTSRWRHLALYNTPWMWTLSISLVATGLWIYSQSVKHFSPAHLGGLPEILPNGRQQRLVTSGIHSRTRHPIYLAHLCEMLAFSVGTGLVVCYALTGFAVVTGAVMVRKEDEELEQRFGEDYRAYRRKVPAVLPRF